jgi:hypothetical protein
MVRPAAPGPGEHRSDGGGSIILPGGPGVISPEPKVMQAGAAPEPRGLLISRDRASKLPPDRPGVRQGNIGLGRNQDAQDWAWGHGIQGSLGVAACREIGWDHGRNN